MAFERIVEFRPAFDKRDPDPAKNYGIHGVDLRMVLRGELGAVQFLLYTNWQLPHVTLEAQSQPIRDRIDLKIRWMPLPADLGYHSPTPKHEGQEERDCDLLPGGKCYYDGSGLNAQRIYETLLRAGSDGVWKELEEYYSELFAETTTATSEASR